MDYEKLIEMNAKSQNKVGCPVCRKLWKNYEPLDLDEKSKSASCRKHGVVVCVTSGMTDGALLHIVKDKKIDLSKY